MELSEIIPHIEALIFASEKPLTALEIVELINNAFGFMEERITLDQVESAMDGIREKYDSEFYPFEVRESGGGWQFLTKKDFHKTIAQLNGEKFLKRLSTAALETLAIIAYKQPITKGEIEAIRGVNSDYSVQKLLEKELIVISGRNEKLPGHPLVYATSKTFMDYFGINSAEDLPKIREVFADQLVEPTLVRHQESETAEFLQADSSEEFPEPHMEEAEVVKINESADDPSQFTINEEGMLVEEKEDEEKSGDDGDTDEKEDNEQQ
jgi:segregation and condensation protein B